jgi:cell division protein FtsA
MAPTLVYGIDVGTTKIVAVAGRVDARRGWAEVLSIGEAPSYGLKRGVVVDRQAAAESVAEAMDACGVRGGQVSVGIAGSHISSFNTEVTLLNRSRNLTVNERFLKKLEQEARQLDLHEDERIIHVVPRGYVLDGSEGVKNPLGLAARKVTMRAHVVSGAVSSIQNLLRAVEDCGVSVSRVVLEPLASAEACLLDADREAGIALVDIGGGTTDVATFSRGALPTRRSYLWAARASPRTSPTGSRCRSAPPSFSSSATGRCSPRPWTPSPPSRSRTATTTPISPARSWSTAPARSSSTSAIPSTRPACATSSPAASPSPGEAPS